MDGIASEGIGEERIGWNVWERIARKGIEKERIGWIASKRCEGERMG